MKGDKKFFFIRGKKCEDVFHFDNDFGAWQMFFDVADADCVEELYNLRLRGLRLTRDGKLDFSNFHVRADGGEYKVVESSDPRIADVRKNLYAKYGDKLVDELKNVAQYVRLPRRKLLSDSDSGIAHDVKSREEKSVEVEIRPADNSGAVVELVDEKNIGVESETVRAEPMKVVEPTADDVPIFTATSKEIEYWHACVNIHVLDFLRLYDLDRGTIAFDAFKIGVDEKTHSATFALDDTHYLKFELNDTNVRPMDEAQAEKILQKINSMRFEKNKKYPYRRVRKW